MIVPSCDHGMHSKAPSVCVAALFSDVGAHNEKVHSHACPPRRHLYFGVFAADKDLCGREQTPRGPSMCSAPSNAASLLLLLFFFSFNDLQDDERLFGQS